MKTLSSLSPTIVHQEVVVAASPEAVHRALLEPARFYAWTSVAACGVAVRRATIDAWVGGRFAIEFDDVEGQAQFARGEFLSISPRSIAFTWFTPTTLNLGSSVFITLEAESPARSLVAVDHQDLALPAEMDRARTFWQTVLQGLRQGVPELEAGNVRPLELPGSAVS